MADYSIEILGQKFSYPTTWHGASSILVVCVSITIIAIFLSPAQIEAAFGTKNSSLIKLNEKLNKENIYLKTELKKVIEGEELSNAEKEVIINNVKESSVEVTEAFKEAINDYKSQQKTIQNIIPTASDNQRKTLNLEDSLIGHQVQQLNNQQQQQQQLQWAP